MNAEHLFHEALQIAPAERPALLAAACAGDAALLRHVEALLRAHENPGSFLAEQPALPGDETRDSGGGGNGGSDFRTVPKRTVPQRGEFLDDDAVGTQIGPYKLLQQIGEGGMGTVYMAQQTEPVKRQVALKLIKPGMDSRQVIARFEAERQALAMMDHVNIAKVLDAGQVGSRDAERGTAREDDIGVAPSSSAPRSDFCVPNSTGRPYFVMELVRGVPITKYCDEHHLTPRERLELFVPVCQAVQHAHQKGIIHRDLKPSNVLVALYDGKPVPKVIDFGVAKAAGQPLTDKTLVTGFGAIVGTLEYMSPEQAEFNQLDIDTRSDIYSLGVLLYELLAGSPPFSQKDLQQAGMLEMLRVIREEEPSKPSTKLSSSEALPSLSANRGTEPARLTKLVRGELDWIVMKALEKDRARRYETANGFAADIQRYLADEPVLACPPSAAYRFRKFARRNKKTLITAALLGTMLLVVAGTFGWMARDQAAQRARTSEAVATLLDQCEEALRADDADQAALALETAERRAADGGADGMAERLARCRADLDLLRELNAIDIFRWTWSGGDRPERKDVVAKWRGTLTKFGLAPDQRPLAEIAARIDESPVRERIVAALDWWLAGAPSVAVRKLLQTIDPDGFRDAIRDTYIAGNAKAFAALAERPEALAQPARFAAVMGTMDSFPEERARLILESALQAQPGDLTLLMTLGDSYPINQKEGAVERVRWLQAALAVHPKNSAVRNGLGIALLDQGAPAAAILQFREAVRLNPGNAFVHTNLGNALYANGQLDEALVELREAVRLKPSDANAHNSLATALWKEENLEEALAEYRESVRLDPLDVSNRRNLATMLMVAEDLDAAIAEFREANRLEPDAYSFNNLAELLDKKGEADNAIAMQREAVRLEPDDLNWRLNLAILLASNGHPDEAIAEYRELIRRDPKHVRARINLGNALFKKGELDAAIAEYRKVIRLDAENDSAWYNLGKVLAKQQNADEAIAAFREAAKLDPTDARPHYRLGRILEEQGDLKGSIAGFREAVRLKPADAAIRTDLGTALGEIGELDEAIAEYREAIRLDAEYPEAHGNLAHALYERGNLEGALAVAKTAVQLEPDEAVYHSNLGMFLFTAGEIEPAIAEMREAIRLDPKDASSHSNLGAVLCDGKGDYDGAIAAFREAIRLNPTDATAHYNLGNALRKKVRLSDAIAAYREAARLEPRRDDAHNAAAWLLAVGPDGVRNGKLAVEHATAACEITKWQNAGYLDTLAAAHAEAANFDRAVEFQKMALGLPDAEKKHGVEFRERLELYERQTPYHDPTLASMED